MQKPLIIGINISVVAQFQVHAWKVVHDPKSFVVYLEMDV